MEVILIENVDVIEEKELGKSFEFLADDKTIEKVELGDIWRRCVAYATDLIVINLIAFFAMIAAMLILDPSVEAHSVGFTNLVFIAYFCYFESSPKQATIGKRWMKLIVMDLNGKRISITRAFLRFISRGFPVLLIYILDVAANGENLLDEHILWYIPAPLLAYIPILFTHLRQGIHDIIAGTVVVKGTAGNIG